MRFETQTLRVALIVWGFSGTPNALGDLGTALGGSWSGGTAQHRTSCAGWDVSMCTLRAPGNTEVVKPAQRDPTRWSRRGYSRGTSCSTCRAGGRPAAHGRGYRRRQP